MINKGYFLICENLVVELDYSNFCYIPESIIRRFLTSHIKYLMRTENIAKYITIFCLDSKGDKVSSNIILQDMHD